MIAQALCFVSLAAMAYIYIGYPLLVAVVSSMRRRDVGKGFFQPYVTILIAAHNEEGHLESTLRNKLSLDYPRDKLEIIVVSDASSDRTEDIARGFEKDGVRLVVQNTRAGKTAALNRGLLLARGEVIVFSDANSLYERRALQFLMENFNDPSVGYVTGRMLYSDQAGTVTGEGCGAYMRYENYLRELETAAGSVVGVDGGIDAVRRSLYVTMEPDQLPDLILPLRVVEQGFRVVYEPRAVLREPVLKSVDDEYRMRVRVSLRALWALRDMRHLMNPARYGFFALQLLSHKYLRYHAFVFWLLLYAANAALLRQGPWFLVLFAAHNGLLLCALAGRLLGEAGRRFPLVWPAYYFALVNVAAAHAFLRFLRGEKQAVWSPRLG